MTHFNLSQSPRRIATLTCIVYAAVRVAYSAFRAPNDLLHLVPLLCAAVGMLLWLRLREDDSRIDETARSGLKTGALVFLSIALLMDLGTIVLSDSA